MLTALPTGNLPESLVTYLARRKEVKEKLKAIEAHLEKHKAAAEGDPRNWGFAGDLGYVGEELDNILHFLLAYKN